MTHTPTISAIALLAALAATTAQPKDREWWEGLPPNSESWHAKDPPKADPRGRLVGNMRQFAPPAKYDKPYTGELIYTRLGTEAEVSAMCPKSTLPYKLGCAFMSGGQAKSGVYARCQVFIVADNIITKAGFTLDDIYRHELAHCNGWPPGHDGAKLIP